MVNFDNSATSFPKPINVKNAVLAAVVKYGGNPGRSGHRLSSAAAERVFEARNTIADFFGATPENVIFTSNCTHALNIAIKGAVPSGSHVIISSLEHNSVSRPVVSLNKQNKLSYSIAPVYPDDELTVRSFQKLIKPDTSAIICTIASNVTGQILPFREIAKLCHDYGLIFIADAAQASGIIPVSLADGINIICTSGHKSLYGITGTGILISDGKYKIAPIMEGGTGSTSLDLNQPDFLPDSLESGTLNVPGIMSIKAGIDFINSSHMSKIYSHETALCNQFISGLETIPNAIIYRNPQASYVPVVSFNIKGIPSNILGNYLSEKGFCLRSGFHCSALAHSFLGTKETGTLRFSPSAFNTPSDTRKLIFTIKNFKEIKS